MLRSKLTPGCEGWNETGGVGWGRGLMWEGGG